MAEPMGNTPENRRESDPFSSMTQGITAPISYAQANNDDDPHPQITTAIYESDAGTPCPSRPERARANNARYGNGRSETATPTIPEPCRAGGSAPSGGSDCEPHPQITKALYER